MQLRNKMLNDETKGEPPDGKENVTKPPGDSIFSIGVNRSVTPVVLKEKRYYKKYRLEHKEQIRLRKKIYTQSEHGKKVRRASYQRNKERIRIQSLAFYHKHKDEIIFKRKKKDCEWKVQVLTHYGNGNLACVVCGENRLDCLSIDHINGGGNKHRKSLGIDSGHMYRWLIKNGFPDGYQTLCMNDQFIKRRKYLEYGDGGCKTPQSDTKS